MNKHDKPSPKKGKGRRRLPPVQDVRITIRSTRRETADYRKLSRALLSLAQAEADAQSTHLAAVIDGPPLPEEAA